jgi:hypothetical protein
MPSPLDWPGAVATAVAEWIDRRLEHVGRVVLVGGVAITALLGAWIVFSGVPTVRGVDLNVILTIQKALGGEPLYTDTSAPPFDIGQYSPLLYLIVIGIARVAGIGPDSPAALLLLARTISTLAALAALWLQVRFATRAFGVPRSLALGAAGFVVVATAPWLFLARPDALAILVQLVALVVMASSVQRADSVRMCALAGLISALALFTKQSAIQLLPIALFFYALLGRWTLAATFTAAFGAAAGVAWMLATWRWPHFAANVIGGVDNGISLFNAFDNTYGDFFPMYAPLLALALLAMARWVRRPLKWEGAFFLAVLTGLLAVATVTALKRGSASNYYNEFLFIAAIAAGRLLHESRAAAAASEASAAFTPLRIVAAFIICWMPFHVLMEIRDSWWKRIDPRVSVVRPMFSLWSADYTELRAMGAAAAAGPGARRVLAFPLAANTAFPSQMLVPQNEIATQLYERHVVDYTALQTLVARNELALVVTSEVAPEPPRSFLGVTLPPLQPVAVVGAFRVFRVLGGPPPFVP